MSEALSIQNRLCLARVCSPIGSTRLSLGRKHHIHAARSLFDSGGLLDLGYICQFFAQLLQQLPPNLRIASLPPTEAHAKPHFGSITQKLADSLGLESEVVLAGLGAHADLFDLDLPLGLTRLLLLLGFLVDVLAIIEEATDGRLGRWCDFDQIQVTFSGNLQSLQGGNNPHLLAFLVD